MSIDDQIAEINLKRSNIINVAIDEIYKGFKSALNEIDEIDTKIELLDASSVEEINELKIKRRSLLMQKLNTNIPMKGLCHTLQLSMNNMETLITIF